MLNAHQEMSYPSICMYLRPIGDGAYWGDRYWGGPYWGARPASFLGPWRWGYGWRVPRCR